MISKVLVCILAPFVVLSIMFDPADAQAWNDGDGGKVIKWGFQCDFSGQCFASAADCDFPGNDIGNQRVIRNFSPAGYQCGVLCINTNGCNHFSHFYGVCYLKKASSIPPRKHTSGGGGVCGFLIGSLKAF